jgi:S-adenosyl-L-methionine hydrolase (adenosine-forming)
VKARPVITLTTDFGAGSPYVAAMKAALLAGCPEAALVDISHAVSAFDMESAGFVLWAGTRHFGAGAVHLAVVDPGVGTARRPVVVKLGRAYWVAPDNGLLSLLLRESDLSPAAVELRRPEAAAPTFEGRDVFAPAAAALAAGARMSTLGEPIKDLVRLPAPAPRVLWVDAFGNLVTSLKPPVAGLKLGPVTVRRSARTYGEVPAGEIFFYTGSMGFIELAVSGGRADALLAAGPGTAVQAF